MATTDLPKIIHSESATKMSRHRYQAGFYWYLLAIFAASTLLIVDVTLGPRALSFQAGNSERTTHLAIALLLTTVILAVHKLADTVINKRTLDDNVTFLICG
jgi:hypothetical protein